jgi:hypothetical protein
MAPTANHSPLPAELPEDFWEPPAPPEASKLQGTTQFLPAPRPTTTTWQPAKLQFWYDGIIDIMIAQPGVKLVEIARQLNKTPVTIGLITRSDMFKLRYEERRKSLAAEMDARITSKLGKVAEAGLDLTLEMLETKRGGIGVQNLKEITLGALDRLGYAPGGSSGPAVVVNNHSSAQAAVASPVSAQVLAEARATMQAVEASKNRSSGALQAPEGAPKEGDVLGPLSAGGLDAL